MKMVLALVATVVFSLESFAEIASDKKSNGEERESVDIHRWAFDVGFGTQSYMEQAFRLGVASPFLFSWGQSRWRLTTEAVFKALQEYPTDPINEYSVSLEQNSAVYKDVVFSYTKWGLGVMDLDNRLYDDLVLIAPVALGLQVLTYNSPGTLLSFFIEYRFVLFESYEFSKSLPAQVNVGLREEALFSGTTTFGVRFLF